MYKFLLAIRYLRSRVLAWFAMLAAALSVFMMLVSVSVMSGFLRQIESAAKGLFGDIIIEPAGHRGLAEYDALIAELSRMREVESASPFIYGLGFLRRPDWPNYRQGVQLAGIRLPERAAVTDFEEGLFVQAEDASPTWDPPREELLSRLEDEYDELEALYRRARQTEAATDGGHLLNHLAESMAQNVEASANLLNAERIDTLLQQAREGMDAALAAGEDVRVEQYQEQIDELRRRSLEPPQYRAILGLGLSGLSTRTDTGRTLRMIYPGQKVILDVYPLGRTGLSKTDLEPAVRMFTVIDDNRSGVSNIDEEIVYLPFETLQVMNNMAAPEPRCTAVHVKVRAGLSGEADLRVIRDRIREFLPDFLERYPAAALTPVSVVTWRERQVSVVSSIEAQRVLVVIMFGIMSVVTVVLIFVIFYTIVVQKTREIGILKAVGAGGWGLAGIFLLYGAVVGLLGSAIGTIGGIYFVENINPIHDWVGRTFGLVVWDRKYFMFDSIPNQVRTGEIALICLWSVVSALVGALVPAIRAASMQPVRALRYE